MLKSLNTPYQQRVPSYQCLRFGRLTGLTFVKQLDTMTNWMVLGMTTYLWHCCQVQDTSLHTEDSGNKGKDGTILK